MSKANEKIKEILAVLNQIRNNIGSVVVYQKEVILVRTILTTSIRSIMKSSLMYAVDFNSDELKSLKKFTNTLQSLHDLVRMLSGDVWTSVALEWTVEKPIIDLSSNMNKISEQLSKLQISIPQYSPTEEDISDDYFALYKIFQSAKGNELKVSERLNSITKYLDEHNIERPPSHEILDIQTIFDEIPQFHVDREDFQIENQIGRGSSGVVYKAIQLSTGRAVAVKELTSNNLDKYEVASLRREIVCLSTLKHKYLIDLIGATTTSPYWIVTSFMSGNSLYQRLKDSKGLDPNQLTIIAYEIAEGMAYLHSKNIIHRDLKTLNILLDENLEPRIGDFGISRQCDNMMTGLVGTFNYMAPEIIAKTGYNLKADVFSYGMMLWEMLKKEIPFSDLGPMNAGRAILNGQRPQIPRSAPKPLSQLIKDCWQVDIERRPSFNEILTRMRRELICFPDADQAQMKAFYLKKQDEIANTKNVKKNVLQSISMFETNIRDVIDFILSSENDYQYVQELIAMMNCDDLIIFFIQNKGIKALNKLFKLKNKEASSLLLHISKQLNDEDITKLFNRAMKTENYDSAEILLKMKDAVDFTKMIEPFIYILINSIEKKNASIIHLLSYFILNQNGTLPSFTVKSVLSINSLDAIEKLLRLNCIKFSVNDSKCIKSILLTSKDENEKLIAVRVALGMSDSDFCQFSQNSKLIASVMELKQIQIISKFLYRICQFESGSKYVLANELFLGSNISSPYILMLFIQIARYQYSELLSSTWFIQALNEFMKAKTNIEVILRICGVLSVHSEFAEKTEMLISILDLLKDSEYSPIELDLVIAIFYNCHFELVNKYYQQFLVLANNQKSMSGKAFKIISRVDLPPANFRQWARILDVIEYFFSNGNDFDGIDASCIIMKRMSLVSEYKELINKRNFEEKLNIWIHKIKNPYLLSSVLDVFNIFGFKMQQKNMFVIEEVISTISNSKDQFEHLIELYHQMKSF